MKKNVVPLLFNNPEYPNYHNRQGCLMARGMNFDGYQNIKSNVAIAGIISLKIALEKKGWRFSKTKTSVFVAGYPTVKPDLSPSIIVTEIKAVILFTVVITITSNIKLEHIIHYLYP